VPNIAKMSGRQLISLWFVGLLLILVPLVGGSFLVVPYHKARLREFALRDTGRRQAGAPPTSENLTDTSRVGRTDVSPEGQALRRLKARQDSLMAAQIAREPADTMYNAYNESPAALQRALYGVKFMYLAVAMCVVVPLLLLAITAWWAYKRRRPNSLPIAD